MTAGLVARCGIVAKYIELGNCPAAPPQLNVTDMANMTNVANMTNMANMTNVTNVTAHQAKWATST